MVNLSKNEFALYHYARQGFRSGENLWDTMASSFAFNATEIDSPEPLVRIWARAQIQGMYSHPERNRLSLVW